MSGNAVRTPPGLSGGLEVQTRGPGGGIGGVAPDGGNSGHLFTVKYAGEIFNHYRPASRHEKQGLCGQLNNGYYFGIIGKSFTPIISGVKYTSYQLVKRMIVHTCVMLPPGRKSCWLLWGRRLVTGCVW